MKIASLKTLKSTTGSNASQDYLPAPRCLHTNPTSRGIALPLGPPGPALSILPDPFNTNRGIIQYAYPSCSCPTPP